MYTEARKLHIIEAVLKTENEAVLKALETIVGGESSRVEKKQTFRELFGVLTLEEAEAMKQTIEENFEKINGDDWK